MMTMNDIQCDCDKDDQRLVTALDGEIICMNCGVVLGWTQPISQEHHEYSENWDAEADLCRKILEERVSKRGWEF